MTPTQLLTQLVTEGGAIVTSDQCSTLEISDAKCTGRFAVDDDGIGYVRRYREWLDLQKAREISHPNTKARDRREENSTEGKNA